MARRKNKIVALRARCKEKIWKHFWKRKNRTQECQIRSFALLKSETKWIVVIWSFFTKSYQFKVTKKLFFTSRNNNRKQAKNKKKGKPFQHLSKSFAFYGQFTFLSPRWNGSKRLLVSRKCVLTRFVWKHNGFVSTVPR